MTPPRTSNFFYLIAVCFYFLLNYGVKCTNVSNETLLNKRYSKTLKMMTSLILQNDSLNGEKETVLISAISSARDTIFLLNLVKKQSRNAYRLPLYSGFVQDLKSVSDQISQLESDKIVFDTTFYAMKMKPNRTAMNKLIDEIYSAESFHQITEELGINSSFFIHTETSCKITNIKLEGSIWTESVDFFLLSNSSLSSVEVDAIRSVGSYDFAEVTIHQSMTSNCTAKVLRLNVSSELNLVFAIPSNYEDTICSSMKDLLKISQDIDFRRLNYTNEMMYITIPIFKVGANVDIKRQLVSTSFGQKLALKSEDFRSAQLNQLISVEFNPDLPDYLPIPMISSSTPIFLINRPFLFAISHSSSQTPLLQGIVNFLSAEDSLMEP